jgi:A/G-specific adenine glycosylase
LPAREKPTQVHMVASVVTRKDRVLVTQLQPDAPRWAGMWLFPHTEVGATEAPEAAVQRALLGSVGLRGAAKEVLCVIRHTVTRFRITLDAYHTTSATGRAEARSVADVAWLEPDDLSALAMPKAHRAIAERLRQR